jgi:ATP-dependent DNA ligase
MEAKAVKELPDGAEWQREPKWDGFRCIAFRDDGRVALQSKAGRPLTRYFPELVDALTKLPVARFVLDGEIVVPNGDAFDFNRLLARVHPAESRVKKLAVETPAALYVFDLLVDARGKSLVESPLRARRGKLEAFAARSFQKSKTIHLSPATTDDDVVATWQRELRGHGIDGIIAKRMDAPYASGERSAMQKAKWIRTADCVVGGFRYDAKGGFGSLLLGLYDDAGKLDHVGFCAAFPDADKGALLSKVERLRGEPGFTGRAPGGPSRWSRGERTEWVPLRPKLVVEVEFDHASNDRFRHGTRFVRFRPDKAPKQCRKEQLATGGASLV